MLEWKYAEEPDRIPKGKGKWKCGFGTFLWFLFPSKASNHPKLFKKTCFLTKAKCILAWPRNLLLSSFHMKIVKEFMKDKMVFEKDWEWDGAERSLLNPIVGT